jgi:tetratricopeptide (TPR) repeat protein
MLGGAETPTAAEDDDITIRVLAEDTVPDAAPSASVAENPVRAPPPPTGVSEVRERAPLVAANGPTNPQAAQPRALRDRYAKIGAAIFAAGVLVGVVASALVTKNGDVQVADTAPSASTAAPAAQAFTPPATKPDAPKSPLLAPPKGSPIERTEERREAAATEKKSNAANPVATAAREVVVIPVSGSSAPSCQQLLGDELVERNAPRAAARETQLANRELVLGNVSEAQRAYCKALAWDRSNVDRHVNLGRFYLFRRDWDKAAEYGQSALELDPKSRRALGVVGDAWAALDKPDEARSAWLAAERKTNANRRELGLMVRRNFALAKRVERLKDFSLAERLYRRVLLLDPKHTGSMKGIASCLLKVGDYQGAEAWARRADMLKRTR